MNERGIAPLAILAIGGLTFAAVLVYIATGLFNVPDPALPNPSGNWIGNALVASPVPIDPDDPALCDDEYNADCDNYEGDDVDPAELAGPD